MKTHLFILACAAWLAAPASAVTIDWVTVGDPGNACDTQPQGCFGAVADTYRISKTEVTNAQYAEFLNAVAATDSLALYNTSMGSGWGGITRSGSSGSYTYAAIAGRDSMPVNFVSFYDSLRFANWLHNGQGSGDTETGAYTLLGGTALPSNWMTVTRNAGATIFLTSEDEWYKAAYFDGTSYFAYPAGTDAQTVCAAPGATANTATATTRHPVRPDRRGELHGLGQSVWHLRSRRERLGSGTRPLSTARTAACAAGRSTVPRSTSQRRAGAAASRRARTSVGVFASRVSPSPVPHCWW